ncbi:MAG: hypothetical protein WDZ52_05790 [Pseudohongiellaceae bacterium]
MTYHRYTQIIVPMDKYVRSLTLKGKLWVGMLELGLLLALFSSMFFYVA